jgi:hypothetical protein
MFAWRLLHARYRILETWTRQTPLDVLGIGLPVAGVIALIYFLLGPLLGIAYALLHTYQPHVRLARAVFGHTLGSDSEPEVWDRILSGRDEMPWVRVWFKNGSAIGGVVGSAGLSPSGRQLCLVPSQGVQRSLVHFDQAGLVIEDLAGRAEGVWLDIGPEVLRVEILT